jgi:serine/threonine protein kinase/tetratricopeptide (TPR) repeat protein
MGNKCPTCHSNNPDTLKFCGECGTQLPPTKDRPPVLTETLQTPVHELTTGSTFANRYQVIEELGHGGMGRVYKVFDTDIKEKIALKLLRPEIALDRETVERFSNELKLARKISHRNVCRMFDLGKAEGTTFITMEFVPGEDLKKFIRKSGQLGAGRAVSIAKQVCEGLTEAHHLGVVHRDLKPQNIMVDEDGNARIMDFGIARSLSSKSITGAGVMIGTPEYMSPEQVEGKDVDQRSDIYSLGIIIYEMLTGRVPFEGDTPFTIGVKHKSERPRDPRELNPQIPQDLGRLVLKCLEKDGAKRYQSAGELRTDLEKIEQGLPTTERVVSKRKPLTSREITVTFGIRKLIVPTVAVISVVLVGLLLWRPWSKDRSTPLSPSGQPSLAVMYFENNTGDEKLDHWRKGISDLLTTDLTQSRYIKVLGGDRLFNILSQMNQLEAKSFSSEVLKEVAAQGGVSHIARGSYSKAGDVLRIDMTLQDAQSGEPIATQRVEGKGEESIFAMVDELTKWAKTSLKLSAEQMASDLDSEIEKVTTSSPEAYKYYLEGRKLHLAGHYQQSIPFMEKAIAIDPGFAMAFRTMGTAYGNMGKVDERRKYLQEALRLSDRLPEREKLFIQGSAFYSVPSTYEKAIETYEILISLYSGSSEAVSANINLGNLYGLIEEWDKAIECYESAIKAGTSFANAYANLSTKYMARGEYDKAKKVLEDGLNRFPDNLMAHWNLGMLYAFQGQFDQALGEADKAAAIDPTYTKARFYHLMWDFAKAEEVYKKWLGFFNPRYQILVPEQLEYLYKTQGKFEEAKNQIMLGIDFAEKQKEDIDLLYLYCDLAYHYLRSGKYQEALEAVEKPRISEELSIYDRIYILEMKGWIYAEMGRLADARNVAEEIKGLVETSLYKKSIRHYHFLTGMIQLKRKDYSEAIKSFQDSVSLFPHPNTWETENALYMYYLAWAYYESGDMRKARDEFERIVEFLPGRTLYGDLYAQSYYRLGTIYQGQGNKAKATENYRKFLDLWKDADPGQPEVADARKRLAGLKGS